MKDRALAQLKQAAGQLDGGSPGEAPGSADDGALIGTARAAPSPTSRWAAGSPAPTDETPPASGPVTLEEAIERLLQVYARSGSLGGDGRHGRSD